MIRRRAKPLHVRGLNPDEILLDLRNTPSFDRNQLEGRVERPISKRTLVALYTVMFIFIGLFAVRLMYLQIVRHSYYSEKSEQNNLDHIPVFADRGVIYDKNGVELTWNSSGVDPVTQVRSYITAPGFAALLGYVSYPAKDEKGKFWQTRTTGKDGIEKQFDTALAGQNGTKLIETNVGGDILTESTIEQPTQGENIHLTIDAKVQEVLYKGITDLASASGYNGGTGVIMNIHTGELLALTSAPEYSSEILSLGKDQATIRSYMQSSERPFLNRAIEGVYTPGSIVKPFFALAALHEHVVTPDTIIVSTGQISVPNPYNPKAETVFKDNAVHGAVDIRKALAVSSNIYFYEIGGGYKSQPGLGIDNLNKYAHLFGIGDKTGLNISGELSGNVPSVAWKAKVFPGDAWRIGDTYHTAIGQYGFQVTPLQMAHAIAAVASRGKLVVPSITPVTTPKIQTTLPFTDEEYTVVQEGMRMSTTEGTTVALNMPGVHVAAKSGTAQIKNNTRVNSWAIGFFPYENPTYSFAVLMEDGPKVSSRAVHAFRPVLDYFALHPELLTQ